MLSTLGGLVAVALSWIVNKSICWAILHFFFSWFYVIYWVIKYSKLIEVLRTWMTSSGIL